ncbi:hypothetical protein LMTR3_34890 [Bradyrhizobium sp. LMTR 3]|nr:hypothetical protein LMTR3_34890 [Bradyrhizobium sp. LMTR 3]
MRRALASEFQTARNVLSVVIASEAKQSMARQNGCMDCFVASLLAMTAEQTHTKSSRSAVAREDLLYSLALTKIRGRREDRVLAAPAVSRAICA